MKIKGYVYASIAAILYGLIPYFSKTMLKEGYGADLILAYRYLLAALIYLLYVIIKRVDVRISWTAFLEIFCVAAFCMAPTAYFFMLSFNYIPTGIATAVSFLYPVVVAQLMSRFYKQRLTTSMKIGIILSVAGVAMVSWMRGRIELLGVLFALLSAITYGVYFVVLNCPRLRTMNPEVLIFYILMLGGVGFTVFSALTGHMKLVWTPDFLFNAAMLSFVTTILGTYFLLKAVASVGSVTTSVIGTLEPLTAMLVGVLHFGELLIWANYIGFLLIILGVILVVYQKNSNR